MKITLIYFIIISLVSMIITVHDKSAARKGEWRISEQTLLMLSAFGGSFAMLATMLLIRHKTNKIKFMAGIPLIIVLQIFFTVYLLLYLLK